MNIINATGQTKYGAKVATSLSRLGIIIDGAAMTKTELEQVTLQVIESGNGSNPVINRIPLWTLLEESAEIVGVFNFEPTVLEGMIDLTVDEMPYDAMEINFLQVNIEGMNTDWNLKMFAIDSWGNDGALRNLEQKSVIGTSSQDLSLKGVKRMIIPINKIDSITVDYPELKNLKSKSVTYEEDELKLLMLEDDGIVYLKGKNATPKYHYENNLILDVGSAIRCRIQPKATAGDFNILLDK